MGNFALKLSLCTIVLVCITTLSGIQRFKIAETPFHSAESSLLTYYNQLISVCELEGRFDLAREIAEKAVSAFPHSYELRLKHADYYFWNAEYATAAKLYRQLYYDFGKPEILLRLGDCEQLAGNIDRAEYYFTLAYQAYYDDESFKSLFQLVDAYRSPYKAIRLLKNHIGSNPDSGTWWSKLGEINVEINRPFAAIRAHEKALQTDADILSLLMLGSLNRFLRSNVYSAVNYTEDRTTRWNYRYRRFFFFIDRRVSDYIYVQTNYLYDQVNRESRVDYIDEKSGRTSQFWEAELSLLPGYDLALNGAIQYNLVQGERSGWDFGIDYSPEPFEIELYYNSSVIDYWENKSRENVSLDMTYEENGWTFRNAFDGYLVKDDETLQKADPEDVPYGLTVVTRDNRGFSNRASFSNEVYSFPEIEIGGFFSAKSYRYDSRYYYSPDEIYLFGTILALHHEMSLLDLDAGWELGIDSDAGSYSSFDGAIKLKLSWTSIKIKFDYLRDADQRQLGFHIVFLDYKL